MSSATMDLIASNALESVQNAERMAPHGERAGVVWTLIIRLFSNWAASWLRKKATVIADHSNQLRVCVLGIQQNRSNNTSLIDPDMALRDKLESIKQAIKGARIATAKFIEWDGKNRKSMPLGLEARRFIGAADDLYEVANQLQWEIAEHDATYNKRLAGFVACNRQELDAMMDRIFAAQ